MIYVMGVGEVPISIAGGAAAGDDVVLTVRAVGAVTNAICSMQAGDAVGIRGPYGMGWPLAQARGHDVVIAAGGIGLAPLRPAVMHLLDHRRDFGSLSLIYGARTPSDLLYLDELRRWRARFDIEVEVTVDRAPSDWYGDVGVVTNLLGRVAFDPDNTVAMTCGPEIMMKVVARELERSGVPATAVAVSMERNMKCGIGFCGHCQYGPDFVCRDGPVFDYDAVRARLSGEER
ncbi:MAG: FAD/NAD(P)-binding protein [Acidimicrobiia bacterium]|nr:FAD/NAD(P)-binding protein [Acidimicrobiia bacterium]